MVSSAGYKYYRPTGSGVNFSPMVNNANLCAKAALEYKVPGNAQTLYTTCH